MLSMILRRLTVPRPDHGFRQMSLQTDVVHSFVAQVDTEPEQVNDWISFNIYRRVYVDNPVKLCMLGGREQSRV